MDSRKRTKAMSDTRFRNIVAQSHSRTVACFLTALLFLSGISTLFSADLQTFSNARLIANPTNDGDSFLVEAGGKVIHLRLYFVDCPETFMSFKSDAQRVREQTRYFGLASSTRTIHFGLEAKSFTEKALAKPFTVYTSFASALGRSPEGRVYGFITTADGDDLAELLVKNGLARAHGVSRGTPGGMSSDEMKDRLQDIEASAMLKNIGIWKDSNPDRIAALRAQQRSEDRELQGIQTQATNSDSPLPQGLIDLNTATQKELESITGIGPVTAKRIIEGRPYSSVDDLSRLKGISPKKLEGFRSFVTVGK
jgi:competence protein ComEA